MAPLATDLERPKLPGAAPDPESFLAKPGALVELGLTFPLFLLYHLGVVFLGIQNATDFLTHGLMVAAEGNTGRYLGITAAIGVIFVGAFVLLSRGQRFAPIKFGQVAVEGAVYALVMRVGAAYVVGRLFAGAIQEQGRFAGFIMSLGAGFYEEIAFRVVLFGLGAKLLVWFWTGKRMKLVGSSDFAFSPRIIGLMLLWAVVSACVFSGVHYVGALGDPFSLKSFLFRALLGLALTLIYATRGFAAAVWTHALYDVWVLVIAGK